MGLDQSKQIYKKRPLYISLKKEEGVESVIKIKKDVNDEEDDTILIREDSSMFLFYVELSQMEDGRNHLEEVVEKYDVVTESDDENDKP
jgi:hypothetical protein